MAEPQWQKESKDSKSQKLISRKQKKTLIIVVLFLMILNALLLHQYIKMNQMAFHNQVVALEKALSYEAANGMDKKETEGLKADLQRLKGTYLLVLPKSWVYQLSGEEATFTKLNKKAKVLWNHTLKVKKQKALQALTLLNKADKLDSNTYNQYQNAIQSVKTPKEAVDLSQKWREQRHTILASQKDELKKKSGGLINGDPKDILVLKNKLETTLKKISSHKADVQKANEAVKQTNKYLQFTVTNQLEQHSAIKKQLQEAINVLTQDESPSRSSNSWLFDPQLMNYINAREGNISIAVYDNEKGYTYLYQPNLTFDTASIVKVTIMGDLLYQSKITGQPLSEEEKSLMIPMIEQSNNSAATSLWNKAGGAKGIQIFLNRVGMTNTTPGGEGEWGLTRTTALDQIKLLRLFAFPNPFLGKEQREYGLNLMEHVTSWERWGVSGGIPSTATVALKNGWLPYPKKWWINSIGYVTGEGHDYCIAVLTGQNPSESYGITTINTLSKMIWKRLGE